MTLKFDHVACRSAAEAARRLLSPSPCFAERDLSGTNETQSPPAKARRSSLLLAAVAMQECHYDASVCASLPGWIQAILSAVECHSVFKRSTIYFGPSARGGARAKSVAHAPMSPP